MKSQPPWEANSRSSRQKIPRPFWSLKVHYVSTRVRHWSLSWASCIQSTTVRLISLRSILILSSYLSLSLPNGLCCSRFPTKTFYEFLISPMLTACPACLLLAVCSLRFILFVTSGDLCCHKVRFFVPLCVLSLIWTWLSFLAVLFLQFMKFIQRALRTVPRQVEPRSIYGKETNK